MVEIVYIDHYAGSVHHGMEFRPFHLAREWVRHGHSVSIVAASFSHLRRTNPQRLSGGWREEILDGVRYVWIATPHYHGNGVGRVFNILEFVRGLNRNLAEIVGSRRPECVIASSTYPFDIFPAARIARRARAQLIFEVHDLWPLTPVELGGMSPLNPLIVACAYAERRAYRVSDRVVSILPAAETHMRERGLAAGKFVHIPNGIDISEWDSGSEAMPVEHARAIEKERARGHSLVGYLGSHGVANALDTLVDAADLLRKLPISLVITGQGPERERLQARAASMCLTNVVFLPSVAKPAVPEILKAMDCLYLGWQRSSLYRFGISPNKILDYMMASKPIVHAVDAANDPIADAHCGISVPPDHPAAVADAIAEVCAMSVSHRAAIGRRGREYVQRNHDYRVLAQRFLDIMRERGGAPGRLPGSRECHGRSLDPNGSPPGSHTFPEHAS